MMPLPKYAARRDANEPEIVAFLLTIPGVTDVERISVKGEPDLRVTFRGRRYRAEVKTLTGKLTPAQREQHAFWEQEGVAILRTTDDALAWIERIASEMQS